MTVSQLKAILSNVDDQTVISFFINDQPANLNKIEARYYGFCSDKIEQFIGIELEPRNDPAGTRYEK